MLARDFLTIVGWLSLLSGNIFAADEKLFETALNGHKQFTETATRYAHIQFSRSMVHADGLWDGDEALELWQNGNDIRVNADRRAPYDLRDLTRTPTSKDVLVTTGIYTKYNNRIQTLKTTKGISQTEPVRSAHVSGLGPSHGLGVDIWTTTGNMARTYPQQFWLHEYLRQPGKLRVCKYITEDGRKLIHIQKDCEKGGIKVDLDPARHFQPVKLWMFTSEGECDQDKAYSLKIVKRFHPPDPNTGITFPAEVETQYYLAENKHLSTATTHIQVAEFDKRFDNKIFELNIPSGYKVVDTQADLIYQSTANGTPDPNKPTIKLSSLEIPKVLAAPPPEPVARAIPYRWLGIGLAVVLFLAAYIVRRNRIKAV